MDDHITRNPVSLLSYTIENGSAPVVERVAWLGAGDFCDAYLVNDACVFRFARHAAASAALRVERCLLPIVQPRLVIDVPKIEFFGRRDDTGEALIGYRLLPGDPLDRDILEALPSTTQTDLIAQIAQFMRQLHDLSPQLASECDLRVLDPLTHLAGVLHGARENLWDRVSPRIRQYHEDLFERYVRDPVLHSYQPAILHGDLSPDHVFADIAHGRLTGVIDWGDACIGDPASDFVYVYEDYGAAIFSRILAHYDRTNTGLLDRKVRILQQFNNVEYALNLLVSGEDDELSEALALLIEQAECDPNW
jgi:aminoglycoside 2''-phosphotransferase